MSGVFIGPGITPALQLQIGIGPDGKPFSTAVLLTHFDVTPVWLEIAIGHLEDAENAKLERIKAWGADNSDAKAATLEREFSASMQAIMACAIAVDAFYGVLKPKLKLPKASASPQPVRSTARYTQVSEVIRRAFHLKPVDSEALKSDLKQIFTYRDVAVHPSGEVQVTPAHPELGVGTEWRFAMYRATNAKTAVNAVTAILLDLPDRGKSANTEIKVYVKGLKARLAYLRPQVPPLPPI